MIASARSGVEYSSTISSKVRRMSSIIASSVPLPSIGTGCGSLVSSDIPSDWARRLAGSMVRTATVRPCSAAYIAIAAAVVVLPTPPAPQQMTTRVAGGRSAPPPS